TTCEITDKKGKGLPESGKGEALEIPHSPEKEPVSCLTDWHYTSQVLIFEIMPAPPAIASQLRIQINEQIYFSRRVRFVEGKPLMLEDSYMPVKLFRNLSLQHLEGSKFEYIEQECGILIGGNYESLTPVLADRLLARQMKVAEHTPLLRITSLSYSESGEFLNYSVMFRNASEYQVEYHLRRLHPEKS
uniref:GntR family transcriptional regulator n=1 Tax=Escherichia coli TaxID=562 RepID=UPI00210B9178